MSGFILSDRNLTNLFVSKKLIRNGSFEQEVFPSIRPDVTTLEVDTSYVLNPSSSKTVIYTLSGNLSPNPETNNISIDINSDNSFEGQEMIWLFTNTSSGGEVTLNLSEKFLSESMILLPGGSKIAQYWFYINGGWQFTVENC